MLDKNNLISTTRLPLGCLAVTGEQAQQFLQGQISCDLHKAQKLQVLLGVRFNVQGRVLANFRLIPWENGYLIITSQDNIANLKQSLDKYAIFSKVEIIDRSHEVTLCGVKVNTDDNEPCAINQSIKAKEFEQGVYYYKLFDHTYYEVICDHKLNNNPSINCEAYSESTYSHWLEARMCSGLPEIFYETSELWTAHQLNLPRLNFIDFDKGCYLGQEIVARMEFRATIKESLYLIEYPNYYSAPLPGEKILTNNDKTVGALVELGLQRQQSQIKGLAVLKHSYIDSDLYLANQTIKVFKND